MIKFTHTPDVYPVTFLVLVGAWEDEEALKFMRKHGGLEKGSTVEPPEFDGCMCELPSALMIWIKEVPFTPGHLSMLSHEACHAVFAMARQLGVGYTREAEEFHCYMNQYLIRNTLANVGKALDKKEYDAEQAEKAAAAKPKAKAKRKR